MTYRELAEMILDLNEEQQNQDVTVQDLEDELLPVKQLCFADPAFEDRLDEGHPVLLT